MLLHLLLLAFALPALSLTPGASIVTLGPGAKEVQLVAAKQAAKQGFASALLEVNDEQALRRSRLMMYGPAYAKEATDAPGNAKMVAAASDISDALESAEALLVVCDTDAPPEKTMRVAMTAAPALKHIGVLSAQGGSPGDAIVQSIAAEIRPGVPVSFVRVGVLKGGGPGESEDGSLPDLGMDKAYNDGLFDLSEAQCSMSHDRFTLGGRVVKGKDAFKPANFFQKMGTKSSFDPCDTDTNRSCAASCLIAAVQRESACDVSVGAAKGEDLGTPEEWVERINGAMG